jgi:thiol-disulfide isomerase/thioredoxin
MKQTWLADIITYFFILLFLYTGTVKLLEAHLFKEQLTSSPLLGPLAGVITWALPIAEIVLAVALFISALKLKALYATLTLMTLFTIYVAVILFMDSHLSCSCGGIMEDLTPRQHVLFNSACVILAGIGILLLKNRQPSIPFRWRTRITSLGLFLIVGWSLFSAFTVPVSEKTGMEGRLLPSFEILLADSVTHFNTANVPTEQPFIIIGFSPWCIHCQKETADIIKHIQEFKGISIYYVTYHPFDEMKTFYKAFHLDRYPNIIMGTDLKDYFLSYFKAPSIPYIAVFDSKKRLKQVFQREIAATILAHSARE